jgi:hypothetical protein
MLDESASLLTITEEQYKALKPLAFDMGSAGIHTLSPNAQIWPRALNSLLGGNDSAIYLIAQDVGGTHISSPQHSDLFPAWISIGSGLGLYQWLYLP